MTSPIEEKHVDPRSREGGREGHLGVETVRLGNSGTYQQTVREDTQSVTW